MRIRSLLSAVLVALSGLVAAAGCGSSSKSGGGGSSSGDCTSLATAMCNRLEQCEPLAVSDLYKDVSTCIARRVLGCKEGAAAPGASITPAQFGACSSAYSKQSCTDVHAEMVPSDCDFRGSRTDGQPCGASPQCKSGYCRLTGVCGTCTELQPAGGACVPVADCQSGLICSKNVCAQPVPAGGHCTTSADCVANLTCKSGTCAQSGEAGAQCDVALQDCAGELFCENGVCTMLKVARLGEVCGIVNGVPIPCQGAGFCVLGSGAQGICEAGAADGAPCSSGNSGPSCMSPAICTSGTCQVPDPASCG